MRIIRILCLGLALLPAVLISRIPDFQVNEIGGPGICRHENPVLVPLPGGPVLALWVDSRNGTEQVFGRKLNADGTPDGADFLFSDTPLELDGAPAVGCGADGRIVAARVAYESSSYSLWARRFSADGTALGAFFRVDDGAAGGYKSDVSIACGPSGQFAIVWQETRGEVENLYLQLYSPSAEAVGGNIRVTDRSGADSWMTAPFSPSLSFDSRGRITLAWTSNVLMQYCRFDADGSRLGSVSAGDTDASNPRVQTDGNDNALIYYATGNPSQPKLMRLSSAGAVLGTRDLPLPYLDSPYGWQPHTFSARPDGSFLVAGLETVTDPIMQWRLVAARFPSDPTADPDTFHVARFDTRPDYLSGGSLASDGSTAFAWIISSRVYAAAVTRVVQVNGDTLDAYHGAPSIAVDADGGFAVAWDDERDGASVYVKSFDADGTPRSGDRRMVDDSLNTRANNTTVTFTTGGRFMAFWKLVSFWVGGQTFEPDGTPAAGNVRANSQTTCEVYPLAEADSSGRVVVVWEGDPGFPGEESDVCVRLFDRDGKPSGPVIAVNEFPAGMGSAEPDLAVAPDGRFTVVWYDEVRRCTRARIYQPDGAPLGPSFDVLPIDEAGGSYGTPRVWTDRAGNILVVSYNGNINAARMDRNGTLLGPVVRLMDNVDLADLDMDPDGRLAVVRFDDAGLVCQCFGPDWNPRGGPFFVTRDAVPAVRRGVAVKYRNGKVYAAWPDRRILGRGVNVWACVTDASAAVPLEPKTLPKRPALGVNYPNPFNPETRFTYELRKPADVTLEVFNVMGKRVSVITRKKLPAGLHEASWNGLDENRMPAPSGVYILRLSTDGIVATRKMVLER